MIDPIPVQQHAATSLMDLPACRQLLSSHIPAPPAERVPLISAMGRVAAADLAARLPIPNFRQSLRDGYALAPAANSGADQLRYPVVGMVRAGDVAALDLAPGTACRIMTGAMVPAGATMVVPQEECEIGESAIRLALPLRHRHTHIEEIGSELSVGRPVAAAGTILLPEHLALLASSGWQELEVCRRPRVAFFCTGSELVNEPGALCPGKKISSNQLLLFGLLRRYGADPEFLGTVDDSRIALAAIFAAALLGNYDMVISTGGVGPGKYDLLEQAFIAAGGQLLYDRLALIPGKGSLGGLLGGRLFFGLPGPPTAVHALMTVLVGPLLMQCQGIHHRLPRTIHGMLDEELVVRRPGLMQLRGATISMVDGCCRIRLAEKTEIPDCYLVIAADAARLPANQPVEVRLAESPFGLAPY